MEDGFFINCPEEGTGSAKLSMRLFKFLPRKLVPYLKDIKQLYEQKETIYLGYVN